MGLFRQALLCAGVGACGVLGVLSPSTALAAEENTAVEVAATVQTQSGTADLENTFVPPAPPAPAYAGPAGAVAETTILPGPVSNSSIPGQERPQTTIAKQATPARKATSVSVRRTGPAPTLPEPVADSGTASAVSPGVAATERFATQRNPLPAPSGPVITAPPNTQVLPAPSAPQARSAISEGFINRIGSASWITAGSVFALCVGAGVTVAGGLTYARHRPKNTD